MYWPTYVIAYDIHDVYNYFIHYINRKYDLIGYKYEQ